MGFTRNIGSRTTTYNVTDSGSTINLAKNDAINVASGNGIVQSAGFNSDVINVDGEIHVDNGSGLMVMGLANTITTGFDSVITGNIGIWLNNSNANSNLDSNTVVNQAQIVAIEAIRTDNAGASILNFNLLRGDKAIVGVTHGFTLTNGKFATIDGESRGIDLSGVTDVSEQSKIVNDGMINGDIAIIGGNERETVTNRGAIQGNVQLGGGADLFDGRQGTVDGVVQGGDGNDTYIIDAIETVLLEKAGGGSGDTVEATISFSLGANFENLVLLGDARINGFGNSEANNIHGNQGANVLKGRAGADVLFGGKGNDSLFGGADADHFIFEKGFGHDTIRDLKVAGPGHDVVDLSGIASIENFADLMNHHVSKEGHDLVIGAGHGDVLTLEHVDRHDLRPSDFLFA